MRAIGEKELADALYEHLGEVFKERKRNGHSGAVISYHDFETAVLKARILKDPQTIRTKWRFLQAIEILVPLKSSETYGNAVLIFSNFELYRAIPVVPHGIGEGEVRERERYVAKEVA